MNADRQEWSRRQQEVRRRLVSHENHGYIDAIELWLRQHAALHSAMLYGPTSLTSRTDHSGWSFEDEVADRLTDAQWRAQPGPGPGYNSIAWLLWHIARIEDVTMTMLVASSAQVLDEVGWIERLRLSHTDVGTAMGDDEVAGVSATIDLAALRAYRAAVGRRTREIVSALRPEDLRAVVKPEDIERLLGAGVLSQPAHRLADVWSRWRKVRFLLMPATRHSFTHLNEARRVRVRLQTIDGSHQQ